MKRFFTFLFFTLTFLSQIVAQERYLEEVFTDAEIKFTEDVHFATNATLFPLLFDPTVDEFVPEDLFMDVYEPDQSIDDQSNRPVVLVIHGGDALPRIVNGACWGDKRDSVTVTTARKLARMGFVAIAPNYRLGWNPLTMAQDAFLDGLVDASVRAQQDFRACARWLRKNVAEDGNTYDIDGEKMTIWGTSSSAGTYSGFAAYINELEEVQSETFFVVDPVTQVPYNTFNEMEAGNIDGTVVGTNALGDTTNYINTPGYSSAFQIAALGSAISLDPGIVDADEPPMIMFGNPWSPVTNFEQGPIQLPTTQEVVAFALLSQGLIKEANSVGVNDDWINAGFSDPYTLWAEADPLFGPEEGWLPLYGAADNEYPWVHWDEVNCPESEGSFDILPEANRDQALAQIDTMAGYFGIRACYTFNLGCQGVSTREVLLDESLVELSPNPSNGSFVLKSNVGRNMREVSIHAFDGRMMDRFVVNNNQVEKNLSNLVPGFYSISIRFDDGLVTKKLVISK